ncbi:diaminobutyrate--2-oxoglutarate transaminase [Nocardiopsis sp. NPDC058789]|uniref:Diaminobutyrate--2-oxoglutarate transaminase n=1 Tax=Nocardiopsis eucommiae TaxID=2831970 RepID=A0A975L8L2_9ACTN|nr:diaminobutyrate--2-oxoglutarate transaminase [Nocardiopsis eucommiae]
METFQRLESEVRGYCRNWPVVFDKAVGSHVHDESGRPYLDFFAGAGSLNYGHNNPELKSSLIEYLTDDRIVHSLDAYSVAKREFLKTFDDVILTPRNLDYKVQFPGPAGNNAVEAALKLARKYTGRQTIINFTNGFHGMTLGALAVTGNSMKRGGAGVPLDHVATMPFDNYLDGKTPDFLWLRSLLEDSGSGLDAPAAVIVEAVQGEGGINVASAEWLRGLSELCEEYGILMILDDIQMGCGRTGKFFSFEEAGITPDIVTLSKSISGYGLPMALTLFKRELDVWEPGEHNGTFRGFNPAMVTGTEALRRFWSDDTFAQATLAKGELVEARLAEMAAEHADFGAHVRGRGLARGLAFDAEGGIAKKVAAGCFDRGLLLETSGPEDEVAKLLPPLTTTEEELTAGLDIMADAVRAAVKVPQTA